MKKIYIFTCATIALFCTISFSLFSQDWVWEKTGGSVNEDNISSVATYGGNIIAAGYFSTILQATGQNNLHSNGGEDAFLSKYSSDGTLQWIVKIGGPGDDRIVDITVDGDGNTYVVGNFEGSVNFESNSVTVPPTYYSFFAPKTFFIAKYNSNGVWQWAEAANYATNNGQDPIPFPIIATTLDVYDGGNDIVVAGYIPFDGVDNNTRAFLVRLGNQGFIESGWFSAGSFNERCTGVKFDKVGNIVLTGYFDEQIFLPGSFQFLNGSLYDIFVAKYTNNLNLIWQKSGGGTGIDAGGGITVDNNNNVYITGLFQGTATFGPKTITTYGGTDFFVAKYNSSGEIQWVKNGGSTGDDVISKIEAAPDGSLYLLGSFENQCNLGNGVSIQSNGNRDIILAKYSSSGMVDWHTSIGGIGFDQTGDVAVGDECRIYVGGGFSHEITLNNTVNSFSGSTPDFFVAVMDLAPIAPDISANGSTMLCSGGSVQLTAANVCAGCTVNWYINTQTQPVQSGATITVSAAGNYTAKAVNTSNPSACQTSTSSNPITVTTAPPLAVPTITPNGSTILCPPNGTVTLGAGNICSNCSIHWYRNGLPLSQTGNTITVSDPGSYTAAAVDTNNGCSSNQSTAVIVTVSTSMATITANGCSLSAPAGSNYNWFINGVLIPGANAQFYQALQPGNYSISMVATDGCTVASQPVFVNCMTPTEEALQNLNLRLWPNPAKGKVSIGFSLTENEELSIELASVAGQAFQMVRENQYSIGEHSLELDISDYPSGMYMVRIWNEKGLAVRKLVIME